MARKAKPIEMLEGALKSEEKEARRESEKMLRGGNDKIDKPSKWLTGEQKKLWKKILSELNKDILSNIDSYILENVVVAIDRLQCIEKKINEEPDLMWNKAVQAAKDKYIKCFFRGITELGMSPVARAKIAININVEKKANPLDKLFEDDEFED